MSDSSSQSSLSSPGKSNPWFGFLLLAPLTVVLYLISLSGLEGSPRGFVIMGVALIQAALAARLLLGVQRLHVWLKGLMVLLVVFIFLLLLMPTWQLFDGTATPIAQPTDAAATEAPDTEAPDTEDGDLP